MQLLQKVERSDWLISGEKGKCYIDNGTKLMQIIMLLKEKLERCRLKSVIW